MLVQPAYAAWYDTDWVYRKNITFNSSQIAQNNLIDFPVLINISDSNLSTFAEPSGYDILFTDGDGTTKLDHEIENFTAGNLVAWVRIPTLSNTTNTSIFMYYNNSAATEQQNRTGVWNESYLGVWHFGEGAGIRLNDSTMYNNNGTIFNSPRWNVTGTAGSIGGAIDFDGVDDVVNVTQNAVINNLKNFSVMGWVRLDTYGGNSIGRIATKASSTASSGWLFHPANLNGSLTTASLRYYTVFSTAAGSYASGNNTMRTHGFQQVSVNYATSSIENNATFYVNGTDAGRQRQSKPSGTVNSDSAFDLSIGNGDGLTRQFDGMISELRLYNGSLSSGWIKTEYNNQYIPSTFETFGTEETAPAAPAAPAPWYNTDWVYRKNITFNSSQIAWNNLTDFPALINISDSSLTTYAEPSGYDILFTDSDGTTKLDHEIENFTYSIGTLVAWVRIPNLYNDTNQTIYMYYNASGVANQQNRVGVWNASWLAVWHFSESAGVRSNDSTRYNNNGTHANGPGSLLTSGTGNIDGGRSFDGVDDYINAGSDASLDNLFEWTVTAWVKADTYGESNFGRIVDKEVSPSNTNWLFFMDNTGGGNCASSLKFNVNFTGTGGGFCANNNTMRTGSWQYIAMTYNRSQTINNVTFYINGTNAGIQRKSGPTGTYQSDAAKSVIIGNELSTARTFNGGMTEVRIYNGTLNKDQIKTEYNNQYIPSTFSSVGGGKP